MGSLNLSVCFESNLWFAFHIVGIKLSAIVYPFYLAPRFFAVSYNAIMPCV